MSSPYLRTWGLHAQKGGEGGAWERGCDTEGGVADLGWALWQLHVCI